MLTQERQDIVAELVSLGQGSGSLTLDQVLDHAPADLDVEDITALLQDLESQGIEVDGAEQVTDSKRRQVPAGARGAPPRARGGSGPGPRAHLPAADEPCAAADARGRGGDREAHRAGRVAHHEGALAEPHRRTPRRPPRRRGGRGCAVAPRNGRPARRGADRAAAGEVPEGLSRRCGRRARPAQGSGTHAGGGRRHPEAGVPPLEAYGGANRARPHPGVARGSGDQLHARPAARADRPGGGRRRAVAGRRRGAARAGRCRPAPRGRYGAERRPRERGRPGHHPEGDGAGECRGRQGPQGG